MKRAWTAWQKHIKRVVVVETFYRYVAGAIGRGDKFGLGRLTILDLVRLGALPRILQRRSQMECHCARQYEDSRRKGKTETQIIWEPAERQHPLFRCYYRPTSPKKCGRWSMASLAELEGKEPVYKGVQCRQAASWRKFCPVADLLPDSIGPQKLVTLLYWFSQLTAI